MKDILLNRSLSTEINSYRGPWFGTTVGLPQDTVISPLHFTFFVSSMFKNMHCEKFKFADDRNLLSTAPNTAVLSMKCQNILNKLESWSSKWKINVKGDQTSVLAIIAKTMSLCYRCWGRIFVRDEDQPQNCWPCSGQTPQLQIPHVYDGVGIVPRHREAAKVHSGQLGIKIKITHLI